MSENRATSTDLKKIYNLLILAENHSVNFILGNFLASEHREFVRPLYFKNLVILYVLSIFKIEIVHNERGKTNQVRIHIMCSCCILKTHFIWAEDRRKGKNIRSTGRERTQEGGEKYQNSCMGVWANDGKVVYS